MFDKNVKLDIPCPNCGYKTKLTIRDIEQNPTYTCPSCKTVIHLNADEFTKGLKDAENRLKDLFKNF